MTNSPVKVIGAGLAGCEAAWQLAQRGFSVELTDMKPHKYTLAHKYAAFAELVCSNSLRSDRLENAVGLLKEEMRRLGSLIMRVADETRVPAGGALAVDREGFARSVTAALTNHPNIQIVSREVTVLPKSPAIIATGPLTSDALCADIAEKLGQPLHFYDAAAPIVTADSLDYTKVYAASRYGRGEDYLNCPMTREEYFAFYHALVAAETASLHDFETPRVFEGCMPVEVMAKRGERTLAFGPMKPVGLEREGARPYAVVQLRRDNADGTLYNIVGFQTNLCFAEQRRVFGMIPGLENAEYARYGVMHRNTFLPSPKLLRPDFQLRDMPGIFFAGQITGVEGYVESAASGLAAGIHMARQIGDLPPISFSRRTVIGSLGHYVAEYPGRDFQPMNAAFGLMEPLERHTRNKKERYAAIATRAIAEIEYLTRSTTWR
ncbi:MAG: methylenetetrahydrofolate--tRNA-(uracil(54)-C(5))-methyltransferase (FADH(2)-oxidizing) TrmFO [Clostridiales bacterium]|nr:methylenetetrahydrofolate--tRNA-(uracil(54)-C(5))-methyltransferase (FADH(2)-oxidizing) TrmFO [Clostridiales bacterium]